MQLCTHTFFPCAMNGSGKLSVEGGLNLAGSATLVPGEVLAGT